MLQDSKAIFAAIFCLFLTLWLIKKPRSKGDVAYVPGPDGGHWFWGHELQRFKLDPTLAYSTWLRQCGPIMKIKGALFHHDILVVADNMAVKHIFQNCYLYVKSPAFRPPIKNLMGEGIVWVEDEMHKQQRRILQPAFTAESVKAMAPAILESAEILRQRLTDHVQLSASSPVNILSWTSSATLDIIGKVGFGHDFQFGDSQDAKAIISSWHKHVIEGTKAVGFVAPLLLRTFPFITSLPIKVMKTSGEIKTIINGLARAMLHDGKAGDSLTERKGTDILSILSRANNQDANALSEMHVIDNISTLVLVGHETVSSAISYSLMSLARAPEIQSKLRKELIEAANYPDYLSYDQIHKLTYLDAVTKESLRILPPSPQTERVALRDDVLPLRNPIKTPSGKLLTSLSIKAGQVIHVPFMAMQTLPSVWGEDADVFKPERWVDDDGLPPVAERPHGLNGLVTFCDGPRNCLGYRLAIYELKVILATLVQHFTFETTSANIKLRISPTLQPISDGKPGVLPLNVSLV